MNGKQTSLTSQKQDLSPPIDKDNIQLLSTPNFLLLCKIEGVSIQQLSLSKLMKEDTSTTPALDLTKEQFQQLLKSEEEADEWKDKVDPHYHLFIDELFELSTSTLRRITEEDVTAFMKGKKELIARAQETTPRRLPRVSQVVWKNGSRRTGSLESLRPQDRVTTWKRSTKPEVMSL